MTHIATRTRYMFLIALVVAMIASPVLAMWLLAGSVLVGLVVLVGVRVLTRAQLRATLAVTAGAALGSLLYVGGGLALGAL